MSHANSFSPFRGKVNQFIIPVSHFKRTDPKASTPQKGLVKGTDLKYIPKKENRAKTIASPTEIKEAFSPPKIEIEKPSISRGVSSLSLSSIVLKKEVERRSSSNKTNVNDAEDKFTQETLSSLWKAYTEEKNNLGENNIAALLEMSKPKLLSNHKILLKTNSSLSKVELTKELPPLLSHLSLALNNYKITIEIKVETIKDKEYIYGVKEKYEYLMKINPQIKVLKNEFDLDL
tara:strand:+ start:192 stop:890 length:699 start_codon:yes stop_codon:yes gene_type:complete